MEEYKKINGFENYSVSNFGNIRNDVSGKILLCKMIIKRRIHALDLAICCPFGGSQSGKLTVDYRMKQGETALPAGFENRIANNRKGEKVKKYKRVCTERGVKFVPFIMYSTGKIHKDGMSFLRSLAKYGHEARQISQDTLLKYYIKLLNFALIKQVSYTIYAKSIESLNVGRHVSTRTAIRL